MRDKAHYLKMLDENPNATIGFTLAAKMVASPHGEGADVRSIARELKRQYGETLTPHEVRAEMGVSGDEHIKWGRDKEPEARAAYEADRIERANNPEAKKLRQGMYDDLEIMAFDFISLLKASGHTRAEAIRCFDTLWDRVRKPDDPV